MCPSALLPPKDRTPPDPSGEGVSPNAGVGVQRAKRHMTFYVLMAPSQGPNSHHGDAELDRRGVSLPTVQWEARMG